MHVCVASNAASTEAFQRGSIARLDAAESLCRRIAQLAAIGAQHGVQAIAELPAGGLVAGARAITQLSAHYLLAAALQDGGAQGAMLAKACTCILYEMPRFLGATASRTGVATQHALQELIGQWRAALLRWLKALGEPGSPLEAGVKAMYRVALIAEAAQFERYVGEATDIVQGTAELQSAIAKARAR